MAVSLQTLPNERDDTLHEQLLEVVRHIRTVHFSLTVACLVVIFSLAQASPSELDLAYRQLEDIIDIRNSWRDWPVRFAMEEVSWQAQNEPSWSALETGNVYITTDDVKNLRREFLSLPGKSWELGLTYPTYLFFNVRTTGNSWKEILAYSNGREFFPSVRHNQWPSTLADFKDFWNSANNIVLARLRQLDRTIRVLNGQALVSELPWEHTPSGSQHSVIPMVLNDLQGVKEKAILDAFGSSRTCGWIHEAVARPTEPMNTLFCGSIGGTGYTLAVYANVGFYPARRSLTLWLRDEFGLNIPVDEFEVSFSELNVATVTYADLELREVEAILTDTLEQTGERVQFLGVSLPERQLASWGLWVIGIIQLYLWIHLRRLKECLNESQAPLQIPISWIGLYSDKWAKVTCQVSLVLLPLATYSYSLIQSFYASSLIPVLFGVVLGGLSYLLLRRIVRPHAVPLARS